MPLVTPLPLSLTKSGDYVLFVFVFVFVFVLVLVLVFVIVIVIVIDPPNGLRRQRHRFSFTKADVCSFVLMLVIRHRISSLPPPCAPCLRGEPLQLLPTALQNMSRFPHRIWKLKQGVLTDFRSSVQRPRFGGHKKTTNHGDTESSEKRRN